MEEPSIISGALVKEQIIDRLDKDLFIRPLLDRDKQINEIGLDLRLGYNFLVNIHGREAYMNASLNYDSRSKPRSLNYFFQETR